ncbi:MAG: heme exporter protein CcmB [Gammaproteobacteria bacterium]|nr:MAG: heme exporter protein CcmB [Gammaproteobacteria bacterium]
MSLLVYAQSILARQLLLAFRRPMDVVNPLLFFAMVLLLFPLGLGPDPQQLALFAPGILWVVALLANLLTADSLLRSDYDDGSLEQLLLAPYPLYISALCRCIVHWLLCGLPLVVLSPLFALMLHLPGSAIPALMLALLLGTAVLSFLGAIGAALTVGLKRGGMLISLIILPLYLPVLIVGSACVEAAVRGAPVQPFLLLLSAMLCLSLALAPLAVAAGLRISVEAQ